ncbi:MAG TPA: glycosyltransferase [Clostridia bacterium]|nr:glycosyltransferase [Clostridia bacterium]
MNICIISSTFLPEMTGVGSYVKSIMDEFSQKGHKVLLLSPDYSLVEDIFENYMDFIGEIGPNMCVRPIPTIVNPLRRDKVQFAHHTKWNLEDYIGSFQPDAVIVVDPQRIYDLSLFGFIGGEAYGKCIGVEYARKKGIPVVAMYQTHFPLIADSFIPEHVPTPYRMDRSGVYRRIMAEYDIVLCACNEVYRFVAGHGLENAKAVVYVGINRNIFSEQGKSNLVKDDKSIKLLYAGRLDADKDINQIFDIFRNLKRECPKVSLYIAGGGTGEMAFREICREEADITCLGVLDQRELVKVYNSVDVYLSPHPTETYGLSVLEAMSKGLPIVTADRGGPRDLVEKGVSGFQCGTMDEYVDALKLLVEDADLRHRMGQAGRDFAGSYYSDKCADNVLRELEILIGKKADVHEKI